MATAEIGALLRSALTELARIVGEPAVTSLDDHARWALYRRAMDLPEATGLLRRCVSLESDRALASAAVVAMLERLERTERGQWVELLDPTTREFAERRRIELGVLEDIQSGALAAHTVLNQLDGWSDWLQLRVVGASPDGVILGLLAEHGRTKRVRRLAQEAMTGPS